MALFGPEEIPKRDSGVNDPQKTLRSSGNVRRSHPFITCGNAQPVPRASGTNILSSPLLEILAWGTSGIRGGLCRGPWCQGHDQHHRAPPLPPCPQPYPFAGLRLRPHGAVTLSPPGSGAHPHVFSRRPLHHLLAELVGASAELLLSSPGCQTFLPTCRVWQPHVPLPGW